MKVMIKTNYGQFIDCRFNVFKTIEDVEKWFNNCKKRKKLLNISTKEKGFLINPDFVETIETYDD